MLSLYRQIRLVISRMLRWFQITVSQPLGKDRETPEINVKYVVNEIH